MRMFIPEDDFRSIVSNGAAFASMIIFRRVELSLRDNIESALVSHSFDKFDYEQVLEASPNIFGGVDYEDELRNALFIDTDDAIDACVRLRADDSQARLVVDEFIRQYSEASLVNLYNIEPDWIEQAFRNHVNDSRFASLSNMVYTAYDASDLPKYDIANALENYDAWRVTGLDRMGSFERPIDALRESLRWYATYSLAHAQTRALDYIGNRLDWWSFESL